MRKGRIVSLLNFYLVLLFIVFSVFFPSDFHHMKKVFFTVIILINIPALWKMKWRKKDIWIVGIGFVFPVITILYSIFLTHDITSSLIQGVAPFFFLLLLVIENRKIDFEKVVLIASILLIALYALIIGLDMLGIVDISSTGSEWALRTGIGYFGKDVTNPFYYKVFIKTSPLLVIPLFYGLYKKNYILSVLAYGCLFVSGTKANVLFPFIGILLYVFRDFKRQTIVKQRILIGCILDVVMVGVLNLDNLIDLFVRKSQESNAVRTGHLKSFLELYISHPKTIFTGMGLGSKFYSSGVSAWISSFEFSFLDLFRQLGVFFFSFFLLFLVYPFKKLKSFNKYYLCAYISYLIIAMTNPLLYSSTGFIMYIYVYYCMVRDSNINEKVLALEEKDV